MEQACSGMMSARGKSGTPILENQEVSEIDDMKLQSALHQKKKTKKKKTKKSSKVPFKNKISE
jgi:hypothetical protein